MSFVLSKILWMLIAPANLFALLLLIGAFMGLSHDEARQRRGRRLCFFLAVVLLLVALFPVGRWALSPLEDRFPPERVERVDGIILLAGDENAEITEARHQPTVETAARRYIAFATLAREYPQARLVFAGGTGELSPAGTVSVASIAKRLLTGLGVPQERMLYEDKSRNTYENAVFAADLVKPKREQNWLLVTSAYHMPRALGCFRKEGWHVFPAPTDYRAPGFLQTDVSFRLLDHLNGLEIATHEYVGLVAYWLMGRTEWPWGRQMSDGR